MVAQTAPVDRDTRLDAGEAGSSAYVIVLVDMDDSECQDPYRFSDFVLLLIARKHSLQRSYIKKNKR